jgi:hypothetical protein
LRCLLAFPLNPWRGPFGPSFLAELLCPLLTSAVRSGSIPRPSVSVPRQNGRSPEVSSTAFRTRPPDLPPLPWMDLDFVVASPLVRHRMPLIRFLFIGPYVCSTLLSDPASRRRPCALLSLHLHQVVKRTFTFELSNLLGTLAVGTAVTRCPPHRPVLALLTHTVPTLENRHARAIWSRTHSRPTGVAHVIWLSVQHRPSFRESPWPIAFPPSAPPTVPRPCSRTS